MIAQHNRREAIYRSPYGAVPTGETVTLRLKISPKNEFIRRVNLHYAYGLRSFFTINLCMTPLAIPPDGDTSSRWYEHTLTMPGEASLFFYWFEILSETRTSWLVPDEHSLSGGARFSRHDPASGNANGPVSDAFQITIYDRKFTVAAWMRGGVMYQIFPDRFRRGRDYSTERMKSLTNQHGERIWHQDWHDEVDIEGKTDEGYLALDFFGGTLQGITEKLDYLLSLGVTILYLNPIFKARSNHRYDTGDYEMIDPMLGDKDDFIALCEAAKALGIKIILDGVFSHTGADSRYFNKYGRYPDIGAWQEETENRPSPYGSWYRFEQQGDSIYYDSWWGFKDLPNVNEHDLGFREYITGQDGIIAYWLRLGASGWRLDVSDELPDAFIRAIRRAALRANPDANILGEIWEDASAKFSYGSYRDFLFGRTHDTVMGYPIQKALLGWLAFDHNAQVMMDKIETIREHYPIQSFYANMTMLGTHDTPRAITVLAGDPDPGSRELQATIRLSPTQRERGVRKVCLGYLCLIGLPGTVSIYYGDEVGMEGYRDPYCRRPFPWQKVTGDKETEPWLLNAFRTLGAKRKSMPVLCSGYYRLLYANNDHIVFERFLDDQGRDAFSESVPGPHKAIIILNRGDTPFQYTYDGHLYIVGPVGGLLIADDELVLEI